MQARPSCLRCSLLQVLGLDSAAGKQRIGSEKIRLAQVIVTQF
ncbi:MAG: hypothetical protein ACTXOO_04955 [Sodalis sp. (in: enterobacteria)]